MLRPSRIANEHGRFPGRARSAEPLERPSGERRGSARPAASAAATTISRARPLRPNGPDMHLRIRRWAEVLDHSNEGLVRIPGSGSTASSRWPRFPLMRGAGALTAFVVGLLLAVGGIRADAAVAAGNATCTSHREVAVPVRSRPLRQAVAEGPRTLFQDAQEPEAQSGIRQEAEGEVEGLSRAAACDDTPIPPPIDRNPRHPRTRASSSGPGMSPLARN